MLQKERKKLVKRLDAAFSKWIRERDGRCLKCGRQDTLQCCHISSRKNAAGRWNPLNAITLCYADHIFWAHKEPIEFTNWLKDNYPEFYQEALKVKQTTVKNQDLEALLKKYELLR